ncbi:aminotransferase class V-fold PLP-dependent enzyme [Flavihumibacter sp. R14]|nr:aminotransferase class V-fold PLP-dependent enzyme [Flavihumibacter soli]
MKTNILTEPEILQLRAETKGTTDRIHFNNAGSSLPPDTVVDTVVSYLQEEALSGGYETEDKYKQQLDNTYKSIAKLINADVNEIATVENASEAWTLAFNGVDLKKGDVVLTCEMEYVTNIIAFIQAQKTCGVEVTIIPNDEKGNFSLQTLEAAITPQVKLIAMTHIPSTAGGMIPIVEIGKIARKNNILYLVDACQSAGQIPIDVKLIGCDMLSVTGRKYLRAPRGTGFLFVKKDIQDKLKLMFADGFTTKSVTLDDYQPRDDARRFELYEKSRALTLGLGKAVDYALNIGVDRIWHRIQYLADAMRSKLSEIDGITLHDFGQQRCGIVTFSVDGVESAVVKAKLAEKKINVSVGLAKSTLYYMSKNHLTSVVRASVHYYNTEEEIAALYNALMIIKGT